MKKDVWWVDLLFLGDVQQTKKYNVKEEIKEKIFETKCLGTNKIDNFLGDNPQNISFLFWKYF